MYDVLHARPVPGIGAVPLAAVAAAIQSQAAPAGANGAVLLEHVKALRQPTELICHAAAAQLTVHSLEVDADADDYELQRVERLLKAWDVPAGAKRGGADDAAAAAQELAVLHVALSAVRQATLRLTRKAKAISGASSSSCSSSSSSSGPSSASPVLAHQCLKQLHELLTSTLTRALRSLHRPQFRWSYTRGPQPGPRAPAVAVAATVQLLPALVAVTAGLASSACARLESSMSALRVASAAKEVEMANVDGVFETRRKVHQDCDAVKVRRRLTRCIREGASSTMCALRRAAAAGREWQRSFTPASHTCLPHLAASCCRCCQDLDQRPDQLLPAVAACRTSLCRACCAYSCPAKAPSSSPTGQRPQIPPQPHRAAGMDGGRMAGQHVDAGRCASCLHCRQRGRRSSCRWRRTASGS